MGKPRSVNWASELREYERESAYVIFVPMSD
jgi:hypothetical protein